MIGDVPYTQAQLDAFPSWVEDINADPKVDLVVHLGDIKSGSTLCDDSYFTTIRGLFDGFKDPLVYTPGDNEWTDCHRPNNGAYNPLERLTTLRGVFFSEPGVTLGGRKKQCSHSPATPRTRSGWSRRLSSPHYTSSARTTASLRGPD